MILVGIYLAYTYTESNKPSLSPFGGQINDGGEAIKKRISAPLNLDFAMSTEIESLSTLPRYMVYNADTGKVYYSKATSDFISPASFTKLMSSMVAIDLIPLDTEITATPESINKVPTILELKAGEIMPASELLRAAIATSANDAAQTLADGAAKKAGLTQKEFIKLMNQKAQLIGMKTSRFANPDGLDDDNQFSSLTDIAQMTHNVLENYPEISSAAATDRQDIEKTDKHGRYYLPNWNGLLGIYPGVNGLKIAYTEKAGYSTIVTAKVNDKNFVAIVSGADSYLERDRAAADLLDAALIAEKISPKKINRWALNKKYKEWGDLARQIRAEIEATKSAKNVTD